MPTTNATNNKAMSHLRVATFLALSWTGALDLAKYSVKRSRMGENDFRDRKANALERRMRLSTGERGTSVASTFSNLNFCAQAITGRHTSWSVSTMMVSM